jgi:hypothetical protein
MFGPHDGIRVRVHPYRRMMKFLMRGRNEAAVYFEQRIDVSKALPWIEEWNRGSGKRATVFHLVLFALANVLHERERLNRFTIGHRTYQRKGVFLSYAAKKAMSDDAPLATVKREFAKGASFADVVDYTNGDVGSAKSSTPSAMDKELNILLALPSFLLVFLLGLLKRLYKWGLAPRSLVDTDPLYTSAFIANLGSIKLDAAYHHLYEHGNCPLFVTIGQIADAPVIVDGQVVIRPFLTLRYTYDERVEDGLYCARALQVVAASIEDPATTAG